MDYRAVPNLPTLFFDQAGRQGEAPFLWAKRDGAFRPLTWAETATRVRAMAAALRRLGVGAGDRVVLVAENRPEWLVADIAIMALGAIAVPAYTTFTVDDHAHILTDSGAVGVIVSTRRLARRVLPAASAVESCRFAITMEDAEAPAGLDVHAWDDVIGEGEDVDMASVARDIDRNAVCCLIYTSGTGGMPKGVMLTSRSILHNCLGAHDLLTAVGLGHEVFLSLLPLSHSYEHAAGMFFPISIGAEIYYCEGPEALASNLTEVRPTIMTAVPRLYEALHARIRRGVERTGGLKASLFERAVDIGRRRYEDPASLRLADRLVDPLLDRLVRAKVKERFGGRLKAFISGGAPLNYDIGLFFEALGVSLLQGYGQTEASPIISCNYPQSLKIDTVGPPLPGVEVKIAADGEILVRGDLLMEGYWNDAAATAQTLRDGWLHTGDVGEFDAAGRLMITDRKKDIIVVSGGDNVSPAKIEGILTLEQEVHQAMVHGDKRPHLVALIVPEQAFVDNWATAHAKENVLAMLADDPEFRHAIGAVVDRVNKRLGTTEQIRRFLIASEPFAVENEMLTPTLKVRRHVVRRVYGGSLDALYAR